MPNTNYIYTSNIRGRLENTNGRWKRRNIQNTRRNTTGTKFVIKNKGFKSVNGNWNGDYVFTVIVQTPKKLTAEQRELLNQLAKTMNEQPPVKKRGIFG